MAQYSDSFLGGSLRWVQTRIWTCLRSSLVLTTLFTYFFFYLLSRSDTNWHLIKVYVLHSVASCTVSASLRSFKSEVKPYWLSCIFTALPTYYTSRGSSWGFMHAGQKLYPLWLLVGAIACRSSILVISAALQMLWIWYTTAEFKR